MTNAEKFKEVFGLQPDTRFCPSKRVLPKTCTRCGAPVNSYHTKCEYCGCEY